MSEEIRLTINTMGGEQREIETPLDITADDLIKELCFALKLSSSDAEGQKIRWRLDNADTGQTLDGPRNLGDLGVKDGHSLALIRSTTAGGLAATAETFPFERDRSTKPPTNLITRFLWWCSGAQVNILEDLPTEHSKYQAIGAGVLADGLLSALSGGYAFYVAFNSLLLGALFGFAWGSIIFNLARFTLSSMRMPMKEEPGVITNFLSRLFPAVPRLVLSVVIGLTVSTPIVIRLFRTEIDERIYGTSRTNKEELIRDIARSEASITALQNQLDEKQKEVDRLRNLFALEIEARGPTKVYGEGPFYRELAAQLNQAQKELVDMRNKTQGDLNKQRLYLSDRKAQEKILVSEVETTPGLLAQIQALSELSKSNPSVTKARWLITLLFLLLYSAPLLTKLLSSPGPYDLLLERQELGSTEKESLAIQEAFSDALDRSGLNPQK